MLLSTVLALARGGRRNPTPSCSFVGVLNYLFPSGQNNGGGIVRAVVLTACCSLVSARHRILDPLTPDRTEPYTVSEHAGRFDSQAKRKGNVDN